MKTVKVHIKKINKADDLPLPSYMTKGSAGMDLYAAVADTMALKPGEHVLVPTGIMIALPDGFEAQLRPRSGLAVNHGITILNTPGTIDSDYRGEIKVILINLGPRKYIIKRGDRIAQMVIKQCPPVKFLLCDELPPTER
ncbi:MAG: dUTP diphosphatase, partial [Dethiobacteria bacterium]